MKVEPLNSALLQLTETDSGVCGLPIKNSGFETDAREEKGGRVGGGVTQSNRCLPT